MITHIMHVIVISKEKFLTFSNYFPPITSIITEDTIRITKEKIRIAIIVDITLDTDFSKEEILSSLSVSLIPVEIARNAIQRLHSINTGRNIIPPAIIPNAPVPALRSFMHPCTVLKASLSIPPTIGTHPFKVSFKAFEPILSAE